MDVPPRYLGGYADRQIVRTAVLIGFCVSLNATAAEVASLKLVQTIPLKDVKGRFDHFSIDFKGSRLFVAALANNTVEAVDLAAAKRIQSITGFSKPTGVLYLAERNQILVANGSDDTLKTVDGADYKIIHGFKNVADADNLRFDSRTKMAWLGYGHGALAGIDIARQKIVATVKLPGHPESFQLETQGRRIFVNVPDARQVSVIDREKRSVIATWPMGKFGANFPMALDETNHRLFVGCRDPARLVVFDTDDGKQVADLAIGGDTDDLFYDTKRKRLYISCGEGFVDVIEQSSPDHNQNRDRLQTRSGARTSFFSPDMDRYYLAVPAHGDQNAELRIYQPDQN